MANIDIERRDSRLWLWILVALVLLALIAWWMLSSRRGDVASTGLVDSTVSATTPAGAGGGAAVTPEITEYLSFADGPTAADRMGVDHSYVANGIQRLAAAVGSLAASGNAPDIANEAQSLRDQAARLGQDAASDQHADQTRQMFVSLAGLIRSVQAARFPAMASDVSPVADAAEAVRADRPLLDQKTQVQAFFDRAATALRRMTGSTS